MSRHATQDIAMGASIKLATARQVILSYIQSNRSSQLFPRPAIVDVLPGTPSLPPASASGARALRRNNPRGSSDE